MKTEQRRNQINERWLIRHLGGAEQAGAGDMSLPVVCRDAPPVVRTLQRERGVFRNFEFDDDEPPVTPEREQVNWTCARATGARRGAELRVERREAQAWGQAA